MVHNHYVPGSPTCVLVEVGTGKTSLVRKFVHNTFTNNYKSTIGELQPLGTLLIADFSHHILLTIGVDFALKLIKWDDKTSIRLQLWDIAGQERFGNMTRVRNFLVTSVLLSEHVQLKTNFDVPSNRYTTRRPWAPSLYTMRTATRHSKL